jgi:thiamine kinase-like enzyme
LHVPSLATTSVAALPGGSPFAFVDRSHPLRSDVERFWCAAADVPSLGRLLDADAGGASNVRSVLRLYPGERRLKWLCVSVQRELDRGFASVTLHYRVRRGRLDVFELPEDPILPALADLEGEVASVLQYVPRHRFTYRRHGGPSTGEIGKAPRAVDLEAGWQRLEAVWRAVSRAAPSFAVAEPVGVDRGRGVFYQSEVAGAAIAERIDAANLATLLHRAGRIHAELQSLDVRGVPTWRPADLLPQIREHAQLVGLFRPDAASLAEATKDLLLETVPAPAPTAFCHGDLRCGHLLEHAGEWSLIDFDGCRNGDPCQDVARLLAFLKRDVPYLRERFAASDGGHCELDAAIAAFLDGHAEAARRPPEPARLTWYLLAHELHFLARMFKRDLYAHLAFERGTQRLVALGEQLHEQLAGRRRP